MQHGKVFHTVYKTTNRVNGKFYIGKHTTPEPNDKYIGSGVVLNRATKKHGIENFTKEIIMATITEQIQAAKAQANADAGRVIELRARIEMMQDELAEAEQRAGASRRAANSLMHYHEGKDRGGEGRDDGVVGN